MTRRAIDYRKLRWSNLNSEEFRHLKLLLFWPIFGLLFAFVERGWTGRDYTVISCHLDDLIPFCEYFLIPYLFWFVYLVGILLYTLLYDKVSFVRLMKFIMITYSITIVIYLIWPTQQNLRPEVFAHDNFLTEFVRYFYQFDTNTNVCPSIHVIGSLAVLFTAWHSRDLRTPLWRAVFTVVGILICISTVFLKQHSALDLLAALPICLVGYLLVFRRTPSREKAAAQCTAEGEDS